MITESKLIDELKKDFEGNSSYISGANDGMFHLANKLDGIFKLIENGILVFDSGTWLLSDDAWMVSPEGNELVMRQEFNETSHEFFLRVIKALRL